MNPQKRTANLSRALNVVVLLPKVVGRLTPSSSTTGLAAWLAAGLVGLLALSGCALVRDDGAALPPPQASTGSDQAEPVPPSSAVAPAEGPSSATDTIQPTMCPGLRAASTASVSDDGVVELSGLARSSLDPSLLWGHNDSGSGAIVHAIGVDGTARGRVELAGIDAVDPEDIAAAGGFLYLGDIGDNNSARQTVAVHRFAEPAPDAAQVTDVETIILRYPDGAHDAEALLVDPRSGELVIVTKAVGLDLGAENLVGPAPAPIYTAEPPFGSGPITLTRAGSVALDDLADWSTGPTPAGVIDEFGLGGVATAADISPDGDVVAVRTYETVWLFDRGPDQSVADALSGVPCEAPTLPEAQGEALAFLDDSGHSFVTASEGSTPALNVTGPA